LKIVLNVKKPDGLTGCYRL